MKLHEFLSSAVDPDISFITEEELYEMANIVQKYSGIRHVMYISTVDNVQKRHGPRIKVSNVGSTFSPTDNFVITVSRNPEVIGKPKISSTDLEDIKDWVILNLDTLMDFWNKKYEQDPVEFYLDLKKL